jgi:hypothetical protein
MGAKDVRTPSNEAERESLLFRLSATTARELDMLPDVIPRAMERYREEVERIEQLGDSPRPQHVIRARNALRTLLGDIYLQPNGGHLMARVEIQNQALALPGGDLAIGGSGGALCTLATSPEPIAVLEVPLIAA